MRYEEWDFPERPPRARHRTYIPINCAHTGGRPAKNRVSKKPSLSLAEHDRRYYQTIYFYQPSGWNSPIVRKVINVYWAVTITLIKALISIPLAIMAVSAFWLLWVIVTL
jgi:hypothetical protein